MRKKNHHNNNRTSCAHNPCAGYAPGQRGQRGLSGHQGQRDWLRWDFLPPPHPGWCCSGGATSGKNKTLEPRLHQFTVVFFFSKVADKVRINSNVNIFGLPLSPPSSLPSFLPRSSESHLLPPHRLPQGPVDHPGVRPADLL